MGKWPRPFRWLALVAILVASGLWFGHSSPAGAQSRIDQDALSASDVEAVVRSAAEALDDPGLAVAVVDRTGRILGVYERPDAGPGAGDIAVSVARTGAFFSNDQAPLSSRTVR